MFGLKTRKNIEYMKVEFVGVEHEGKGNIYSTNINFKANLGIYYMNCSVDIEKFGWMFPNIVKKYILNIGDDNMLNPTMLCYIYDKKSQLYMAKEIKNRITRDDYKVKKVIYNMINSDIDSIVYMDEYELLKNELQLNKESD